MVPVKFVIEGRRYPTQIQQVLMGGDGSKRVMYPPLVGRDGAVPADDARIVRRLRPMASDWKRSSKSWPWTCHIAY